ncbi:hypothetical protein SISSUDRAFT_984358 [Sistotremastrum suecicum HHB10207 ss-3]|uniref:Uncharacterized protein n=1 Tax=Sistotremastrum suecicum HHB10207 ss-3 TaxID=1314776 RepID=A0A166EQ12_9AGAM|nr:hypothetical protein SISSUDRAFT_984358 [Sistotremastrum suecicum HHB10207 ss-3]
MPCVHDPGNGPRVKDLFAFIESAYATKPTLDDPQCREYYYQDVLDLLVELLPRETAVILWYNKTRLNARICPTCRRFYKIGQTLPTHAMEAPLDEKSKPLLEQEQTLSGICSFLCFGVAVYNYPGTVDAWGLPGWEMDDATRDLLNAPSLGAQDEGLGLLVKLSRLNDPGFQDLLTAMDDEERQADLNRN